MKSCLQPGLTFKYNFKISETKTVPHLLPEAPEFQEMPKVLASGFMVGLFELACIKAINPFLNWPSEQTVGTDIKLSHIAATPPGFTITVRGVLDEIDGRKLFFTLVGHDDTDLISKGTHERHIIDSYKFSKRLQYKISQI